MGYTKFFVNAIRVIFSLCALICLAWLIISGKANTVLQSLWLHF